MISWIKMHLVAKMPRRRKRKSKLIRNEMYQKMKGFWVMNDRGNGGSIMYS